MEDLKIGDVIEVNISGVYTSCLVVDIKDEHTLDEDEYGLIMTFDSPTAMHIWPMPRMLSHLGSDNLDLELCCELLIGNQKVWCESCHWEDFIVQDR